VYFCTGTEPDFKHTCMTFRTGKLIKNLHLPVQNEKTIYRQPECIFVPALNPISSIPARHFVLAS
jgi:hypothetical protein